jgi:hypothetical protein
VSIPNIRWRFVHHSTAGTIVDITTKAFGTSESALVGPFRTYVEQTIWGDGQSQLPMRVILPMLVYLNRARPTEPMNNTLGNPFEELFAGALLVALKVISTNSQRTGNVLITLLTDHRSF